jgi:hypothetical protein
MSKHELPEGVAAAATDDPQALRRAWRELRERHPHLHGPDAAALLGVPEAALLASRVGDGAVPLEPDLDVLLEGCAGWGKLLFAARNGLGVAIGILDDAEVLERGVALRLRAAAVCAHLDRRGAASAYLFEERDGHGHTVSLNWFDAAGHAVGRLFLMSKAGRERAEPMLRRHERSAVPGPWRPGPGAPVPVLGVRPPPRSLRRLDGVAPSAIGERAVLGRDAAPGWHVHLDGPGVAIDYRGPLARASRTPPAVHATDALFKLHLRMQAACDVHVRESEDGLVALQWSDPHGGTLTLAPQVGHEAARAWIASILAGGHA